jgi:hypothetical protein
VGTINGWDEKDTSKALDLVTENLLYTITLDLYVGDEFKAVKNGMWGGDLGFAAVVAVLPEAYEDAVIDKGGNILVEVNGNYEITLDYTETTKELTIERLDDPVVAPPVVTYDLPEWRVFTNSWDGSAASHEGVDGELVMTVENANFSADPALNWNLQIIQDKFAPHFGGTVDNEGHMQLVAGETYRVSLDVRSSIAGNVKLAIGHPANGWTPYHEAVLAVTTETQTLTSEFTLDAAGDFTTLAQFKIEMGNLFSGAVAGSTFTLDNVIIEEKVDEVYEATSLIVNGTMSKESELE